MGSRSRSTRAMAGILDVHVHHASGLQSLNTYGEQDVYARFLFGELDPLSDAVLQTKTIRKGGNRPNFDQSLQIGVPEGENVLKCEVFMAQPRSRDKLLGSVKIPLEDVMTEKAQKQRKPNEYRLVSSYMDAPAGTLTLTLAYHGRQPVKSLSNWREPSPGKASPGRENSLLGGSGAVAALRLAMSSEKQGGGLLKGLGTHRNSFRKGVGLLVGGMAVDKAELSIKDQQKLPGRPEATVDKAGFMVNNEWFGGFSGMRAPGERRTVTVEVGSVGLNTVHDSPFNQTVNIGLALMLSQQESSGKALDVTNSERLGFKNPATDSSIGQRKQASESQHSGEAVTSGTRLMQLLPLEKCKEDRPKQVYSRGDAMLTARLSKIDAVHPPGKKLGSAFKPYAPYLGEAGLTGSGLKRPRSASGLLFDASVSPGTGSPIIPTPIRPGLVKPGGGSQGVFDYSMVSLGLGSGHSDKLLSLAVQTPSDFKAKRLKCAGNESANPVQTAGEFSALLRGSDDDDNVRTQPVPTAFPRSAASLQQGKSASTAQVGAVQLLPLTGRKPDISWADERLNPLGGGKVGANLGEDQVTPTSVLQQQTSEGNSSQTEGAASEQLGTTAESKSVGVASQLWHPAWKARGASEEASAKGSSGLPPDTHWFTNSKTSLGQGLLDKKLLSVHSTRIETANSIGDRREYCGAKSRPVAGSAPYLGSTEVAISSGSSGGDIARDRGNSSGSRESTFTDTSARTEAGAGGNEGVTGAGTDTSARTQAGSGGNERVTGAGTISPDGTQAGTGSGGVPGAGHIPVSQSEKLLGMSESEQILHQQAAAVWQASQMLMREQSKGGSADVSQFQVQVRAHQQAAAMWQGSMGMSKEQAEAMWQGAVAAGTISPEQAAEFRQLWAQASRPHQHLQHMLVTADEQERPGRPEEEEHRRKGWKDFWERLSTQRKEVVARDGSVRYGSHAFF